METRDKKLADVGEDYILENIVSKYLSKPFNGEYLHYPEDVRDIIPKGPKITLNIDGYSLSSAKLPWRSWSDVGYSATAGAISDHVAKGSIPREVFVSLGLRGDDTVGMVEDLFRGINDCLKEYDLRLMGGDLNKSLDAWIDVVVIGYTPAKRPPRRNGGVVGDKVFVTGKYGAMGVVAIEGVEEAGKYEWVREATRRPRLNIELANIIAINYRAVHASMDVSDGLGFTLYELSRRSGVGLELWDKPVYYEELEGICGGREECLWEHILNGGEEYGVVMMVDNDFAETFSDYLEKFSIPYKIIGETTSNGYIRLPSDLHLEIKRWDHFKGWRAILL